MRNGAVAIALIVSLFVFHAVPTHAVTRGTPAEAQEMLSKAGEHYKAAGRKQALATFTAGKAPFRDRDLYVVCVATDSAIAANGAFPSYVGTSADALVDAKGNPLGKALWSAASKNSAGSIQYPMLNPGTGKVEVKTTFYSKVADDLLCGVGAYSVH
jgi:hypothetical protein